MGSFQPVIAPGGQAERGYGAGPRLWDGGTSGQRFRLKDPTLAWQEHSQNWVWLEGLPPRLPSLPIPLKAYVPAKGPPGPLRLPAPHHHGPFPHHPKPLPWPVLSWRLCPERIQTHPSQLKFGLSSVKSTSSLFPLKTKQNTKTLTFLTVFKPPLNKWQF